MCSILTKICTKCGLEKPLDEFRNDKRQRFGKRPQCRNCENSSSGNILHRARWRVLRVKGYTDKEFTITHKDIENVPSECFFCKEKVGVSFSLHRLDSHKGYAPGNISKVHEICHQRYHYKQRKIDSKGRFLPNSEEVASYL